MKNASIKVIYLKDYQKPDYLIQNTYLLFDLDDHQTKVQSKLTIKCQNKSTPLVLQGGNLKLHSIEIEGKKLSPKDYKCTETRSHHFQPSF